MKPAFAQIKTTGMELNAKKNQTAVAVKDGMKRLSDVTVLKVSIGMEEVALSVLQVKLLIMFQKLVFAPLELNGITNFVQL